MYHIMKYECLDYDMQKVNIMTTCGSHLSFLDWCKVQIAFQHENACSGDNLVYSISMVTD